MTAERQAQINQVAKELRKMRPGHCGIKFDVMVWRLETGYIVGRDEITKDGYVWDLDSAASLINDLRQRAA